MWGCTISSLVLRMPFLLPSRTLPSLPFLAQVISLSLSYWLTTTHSHFRRQCEKREKGTRDEWPTPPPLLYSHLTYQRMVVPGRKERRGEQRNSELYNPPSLQCPPQIELQSRWCGREWLGFAIRFLWMRREWKGVDDEFMQMERNAFWWRIPDIFSTGEGQCESWFVDLKKGRCTLMAVLE